jgi:[ribosomal protein S18]-alanine N-acetyltransferase
VRVRRATAADVPLIVNLEREAASAAHWPKQQYDNIFLSPPNPAFERYAWVAEEPREDSAEERKPQPQLLGFLVATRTGDECELENVVVSADNRRKGIGALLLAELQRCAREPRVSSIFLEVRESNCAARAFYEKFGFVAAGSRNNYYSNPPENAVVYRFNLC